MQGVDLSPLIRGQTDRVRDRAMVECGPTHLCSQLTLITESHKLVVYRDEEFGELYDLRTDPDQHRNLWTEHPDLRHGLMQQLLQQRMLEEPTPAPRESFA